MDWFVFIQNTSYFTIAVGALSWLSKVLFDRYLTINIENHKNKLLLELEKHKEDLKKNSIEYQIRFSKLHEKQAEAIEVLYLKSRKMGEDLKNYFDIFSDDNREQVLQSCEEFNNYFDLKTLYFKDETCRKIKHLLSETHVTINQIQRLYHDLSANPFAQEEKNKISSKIHIMIEEILPDIHKELKEEFRVILGV